MMPLMDGWQVLRKLRESHYHKIPVLMLTAKSYQEKDLANAAELGATQFLRKPFDPAELAVQVRKLVVK
jgi:DNA-binding response OmpR family regulator